MILRRVLLCALIALCLASAGVAEEAVKDRVSCYTTWDDTYFYLAFKIDCPDVQGTHTQPNTDLTGDDSVEFYVETDNKHSMKITPQCMSMAVSAGGGSRFLVGSDKGSLDPAAVYSYKFGTTVMGTNNNPDDIDMGYSVEMAVPWQLLNIKGPALGNMMSFNVIVRRHGDKAGSFVSLSPRVKSEEDALVPAKWVNIVFAAHTFGVATTTFEKILSAKYVVRSPLIDGVVNDREWHQNTSFSLDLPMPPGFVYEAKFPVQRTVLTKYIYKYQADPRKAVPVQHVKPEELKDTPAKGIGPWFSFDRVQWHKDELSAMTTAGIGIVLPDYLGAKDANGCQDKGLDCMVAALSELDKEGKSYPMVGMFYDCSKVVSQRQPGVLDGNLPMQFVYANIKSFFSRIPLEYRAYAPAGKPNAGVPAAVVFLANVTADSDPPPVLPVLNYCSEQFQKDFGCPLVWLGDSSLPPGGSPSLPSIAEGTDGVCGAAGSRISIDEISADDSYDTRWQEVLAKNPLWIYCDAWNDFTTGKCICATGKLGTRRQDSTKGHVRRFLMSRDYSAQFLRFDVPRVIPPKQIAQAHVVIRNAGNTSWRAADGYALGYRWYRGGRYFGESKVRMPLSRDVPAGDIISLPIGIATISANGAPMPEGNCEIRLELIRLSDNKWFSALGDLPLMAPLTIGTPPEWDARCMSVDAPNMMGVGAAYPLEVRVRNDGTQLWKAGSVKLGCSVAKTADGAETRISDVKISLSKDCKPGEIAQFKTLFSAGTGKKAASIVATGKPTDYRLVLELQNANKPMLDRVLVSQAIGVFDADYGVRIVDSSVPPALAPGQSLTPKVVVRNTGAVPWDGKKTKIGYHWYDANGAELVWDGAATPLKTATQPGWPTVVTTNLLAPDKEGKYTLVWDLMIDGKWLSPGALSRGGDILPVQVEVTRNPPAPETGTAAPAPAPANSNS